MRFLLSLAIVGAAPAQHLARQNKRSTGQFLFLSVFAMYSHG
jgi:hypothetical protein